ncbi:serine/threonine-protein phosphatase 4 regulatory subunit 2 isoform X2 [Latimeria chalumnae]|uniref:serine/threonine-protein phosphatase 4 regulatory subunit 2 isoform X2 n=1 Tax=Latimeria chalumnae TaxID=7897 RepID=UPI0006D8D936|nr:PREDICTED: serine/threonine-protein phosphatase 4 regulatory subunit 2 isoform X2 [Latimeria chalumnae]|eukprot:XP_014345693.1 PREDICTED: serine/threonine-protein phosphatase 4 regulatory subunit 2 isoform X2 [Latimeria chalumnae]
MDIDTLVEALKDFEKKGKKEACPVLDQFLCHVAKTGETMIQWTQFKCYFTFKLEKVMDDFRASAPEPRGPPNPNVEYVPFEEMKERILKIVDGFNGIPFTIQRLCELLTDPKRNYTGTDKFLRGVEKNVMVVSCVYPSSEKNGSNSLNRMNGVMFPGNSPNYTDSDSPALETDNVQGITVKNKHSEEDPVEAEGHEVKRLKFDKEEQEAEAAVQNTPSESSMEMPEESETSSTTWEEEEPVKRAEQPSTEVEEPSSTQLETPHETDNQAKDTGEVTTINEVTSHENNNQMDESDQSSPEKNLSSQAKIVSKNIEFVSSSNVDCSGAEEPGTLTSETSEIQPGSPMENSNEATEASEEPMEQD